jgi:two-component system CheB/CheR fusion protein
MPARAFPVVGIGASAGGLEACNQFLRALPADTGMAFALVMHLNPRRASLLTELLARVTAMTVVEMKDGMAALPNHLYVNPPDALVEIRRGRFQLSSTSAKRGQPLLIDQFLCSLAADLGHQAIGVVLSGMGSDGTLGLKTIRAEGGLTLSQDEASAKYGEMPRNAIASGAVDLVLAPEELARELERIAALPHLRSKARDVDELLPGDNQYLASVFTLLQASSGVDFTHYKPTTIKRRIARRMALHRIEKLDDYVRLLKRAPIELEILYRDMLINVTRFFRDPDTFAALRKQALPQLTKALGPDAPLRVWVPACSTGEEVYSIAITLLEQLAESDRPQHLQVFATDISDQAIDKARAGRYPASIEIDVSADRLRRFFLKTEGGYQISKSIRDMCVFARQDVTRDPPFSRIDLISCRNMLIYMGPLLQKKLIPLFHYALNPGGVLMLGSSETIGASTDLFSLVDKQHKIYVKKTSARRTPLEVAVHRPLPQGAEARHRQPGTGEESATLREAERLLLAEYTAPSVVVDDHGGILQLRGPVSPFIRGTAGARGLNLLKVIHPALAAELRAALKQARNAGTAVRSSGLRLPGEGQGLAFDLLAVPFWSPAAPRSRHFLVLFDCVHTLAEPRGKSTRPRQVRADDADSRLLSLLRQELVVTKEHLQSSIEVQEANTEELHSALEEIQSSNEELQSTNEELETAKEELQSTNEELTTVNEELETRNSELVEANNDLINLNASIHIPIIILGNDQRIRRFTPSAGKLLNLVPSDVGRPLSDFRPNLDLPDLGQLISEVADTLVLKELEVRDRSGQWYSMRIRPYKTADQRVDGVVVAWFDIDAVKTSQEQIRLANAYADAVVEMVRQPLVVLDHELKIRAASKEFFAAFDLVPEQALGRPIHQLGARAWDSPGLRDLLGELLRDRSRFDDFVLDADFPGIGRRRFSLDGRCVDVASAKGGRLVLLSLKPLS